MGTFFNKTFFIYFILWLCVFVISYYCFVTTIMIPSFQGLNSPPDELNKNLFELINWHWNTYLEDGLSYLFFYGITAGCLLVSFFCVLSFYFVIKFFRFLFSGLSLVEIVLSVTVLWVRRIFEFWKYENKLLFIFGVFALPTIMAVILLPILNLMTIYLIKVAPVMEIFYSSTTNTEYWFYHWGKFQAPFVVAAEYVLFLGSVLFLFIGFLFADIIYRRYKHVFSPQ